VKSDAPGWRQPPGAWDDDRGRGRVTDEDVMAHKGTQAILLQDVDKLGRKGDVVNVAAGYMRNFLQPRKLALPASDGMVAQVQRQEELRRRHEAQSDEQAREIAHTLNRTVLTIKARAGAEDRLYGSVTSSDIADAIWKARKIRVDRRKVELEDSIKALGSYRVGISVWGDVDATIKVMVVPGAAGEEGGVEAFEAEPDDY
jgi:large subunit ribosomal protein L9